MDDPAAFTSPRNPNIYNEMRGRVAMLPTDEFLPANQKLPLMVNLYLVGNHRALIIAQRFDIGDRKITVVQFGKRLLQGGVQVVMKRELCWRSQDARIHAILRPVSLFGDKLNLSWRDRRSTLRLIVKPVPRCEQHENQNQDDRDVVLPRAALVGPEKRAVKNLAQACHNQSAGTPSTMTPSRMCTTRSK